MSSDKLTRRLFFISAKKEPITSSNITGSPNVKRTAEYEELLEAAQQSSGLPVYQNEPVLQA